MKRSRFEYSLPKNFIANAPANPRDHSRLLVLDRVTASIQHKHFYDLSDIVIFFSRCSHFGPKEWRLYLWDRDEYYEFNVSQGLVWKEEGFFEKDSYCPECRKNDIIAKSISCCLCGRKIAPNSPVCLYSLTSRGLK